MASFRDFLNYYRNYWLVAALSIAASSLFEIIDLVVPYVIGQILNVLSNQSVDKPLQTITEWIGNTTNLPPGKNLSLGVLLGLVFLVTVIRAPIQPWLSVWYHWGIALRTRYDHAQTIMKKILTLPVEFYDENNPGRIAGRIAKGLDNHIWTYPEIAGQLIPKLVRILGIFCVIWFIEWRIALFFFISFIGILVFLLRDLKMLIQEEKILLRHQENTESRTSEIITNIKTVKAFATEAQELHRNRNRLERELKYVFYRIHLGYVKLDTWQGTVVQTCIFVILFFTLRATILGQISLGHFFTTLTVSSMAYAEIEPISLIAEMFARRYASMTSLHEFMQLPKGQDAGTLEHQIDNSSRFTGKIEFCHVSFGYDSKRLVLQDINLLIEPYQTVALVGRSGSGKSTLVKLLFRYFEPNQGKILIDGEEIRNHNVTHYRKRLAIVHQEVDIFNGTLLDNLTYGDRTASFEQVQAACRIARVDEFIPELPNGYYTIVGERGVRLSGGQKQRLGIARALIVNPDILVFDEATSSLDYESERSIQLAMRSILGTRSTLIIAHRLSTVREADKIVVLDAGRIVEVGNHEELLKFGGIYQRLHSLQETGQLLA